MANFFSNIVKKIAQSPLPPWMEKKREENSQVFPIGEGPVASSPEQQFRSELLVKGYDPKSVDINQYREGFTGPVIPPQKLVSTKRDPIKSAAEAFPRLAGNFFVELTNKPIQVGRGEPIIGLNREFDVAEEKYGSTLGPVIAGTSMILDADPRLGFGKKAIKETGEEILKRLGKDVYRDAVASTLFRVLPKIQETVNTGGSIDQWADLVATANKIEKGTDKVGDLHKVTELLSRQGDNITDVPVSGGFTKKELPDLTRNPEAGFIKIPSGEELRESSQQIRTQLIDQYSPLYDLTKGKLAANVDPYVAARNFAGHYGKVQNRLDELSNVLVPIRGDLEKFVQYAKLERFDELARRGITDFEGGLSVPDIAKERAKLIDELGLDKVTQFETQLAELKKYNDEILTYYKDSGMISENAYRQILINNEKYLPLHRIEYLDKQADNLPVGSSSFNVSKQNLIYTIKGSQKEIANPLESIVRNTYRAINTAERNKVAQQMAALSTNPDFAGIIQPVKGALQPGYGKFSVFINGIKQEFAAPEVIVDVIKNLNSTNADFITKLASKSSAMLRAGATILNAAFIPTNAIRDAQNAILVSKVGFTPADWVKGFAEALFKGDDYKAYLESGASYSGFFERNKNLSKTVKQLTQKKSIAALKFLNPFEVIRTIGEKVELAPRIGVYKKAVKRGQTQAEAAFTSRNATIDFAKSGSSMKIINQWVPFLNARTQGATNLYSAVKNRPARSALVIGGMVGIPVAATYIHNTRNYPEIWADIADFEKDNNVLVVYGDNRDEEGNPTEVLKIPKADVLKIFGNPLEEFLSFLDNKDNRSISDVALQMFSDASPISFAQEGDLSARQVLSGLLPPTIKAATETATNKNLFTGFPIVPESMEGASPEEQYKNTTSPVYIKLGEFLKVSPLLLENAARTQFGGLAQQVINPGQVGSQVASRFSGARGGQQQREAFDELGEVEQEYVDKRLNAKRTAESIYQELIELPPSQRQQRSQELAREGTLNKDVIKQLDILLTKKTSGLNSFEEVLRNKPVDVRARLVVDKLKNLPLEERQKLFKDWAEKKIITPDVIKAINKVLTENP